MPHPSATSADHAHTHAQRVIDSCMDVYKVCRQTAAYCSSQGGDYADPHRLQVLYDCAESHLLAGDFLARASRFNRPAAQLAADLATACAEAFQDLEHDDKQLRKLYAVCMQSTQVIGVLLGEIEKLPQNDQRDEALKESFPASDPPPPPTEV